MYRKLWIAREDMGIVMMQGTSYIKADVNRYISWEIEGFRWREKICRGVVPGLRSLKKVRDIRRDRVKWLAARYSQPGDEILAD